MTRLLFLLLVLSSLWFRVSSLRQLKLIKLLPRKSLWNPYHPNDQKILELLDFSAEDSDYYTQTFGQLSDVETKITDKHLKVNGRHYKIVPPYETVDHLEISQT